MKPKPGLMQAAPGPRKGFGTGLDPSLSPNRCLSELPRRNKNKVVGWKRRKSANEKAAEEPLM